MALAQTVSEIIELICLPILKKKFEGATGSRRPHPKNYCQILKRLGSPTSYQKFDGLDITVLEIIEPKGFLYNIYKKLIYKNRSYGGHFESDDFGPWSPIVALVELDLYAKYGRPSSISFQARGQSMILGLGA